MDTNQETGVSLDDLAGMLDESEQENQAETTDEDLTPDIPTEDAEEQQAEPDESGDEELVETEFEGKRYKVPAELKEALLRQSDYTRKTQEVAEMRRTVEQQAQLFQQQQQVFASNFDKAAELKEIQNRLSQFDQIDWQTLSDQDPVQAQKLFIARQNLERQAQAKSQEFQQSTHQYQQLVKQTRDQQLQVAAKELMQRVPEYNSKIADKIRATTKSYGYSEDELAFVTDPRLVHILHDFQVLRDLHNKMPVALKKVAEAPKVVKPQAQAPKPKPNQAALQRLKSNGRVEDLASFL
jgi:hypothetical protein